MDTADRIRYLKQLSVNFPTISAASTEIINLSSILNLPKGTEHFITDLHGEYEQVLHVLKNGSGSVRQKIDEGFSSSLSEKERRALATLIYYPEEKQDQIEKELTGEDLTDWQRTAIHRLIGVTRIAASKYTRSKVRKALPPEFSYVMEELLLEEREIARDKEGYYSQIIQAILETGQARAFITAFCRLIPRLIVDHLHVIGDIYDRGPGSHILMDRLMETNLDVQWGNHDIGWMGAAAGSLLCIANVIRLSARYGNLDVIEEGYGINLIPLARFATETYRNDPCTCFDVHYSEDNYDIQDLEMDQKIHKAIAVIQFKLECQLILRRPEFHMEDRLLLGKINYDDWTVRIDGKDYPLEDTHFPTVDPEHPFALSKEEAAVMERLRAAFTGSEKLQRHIRFLYAHGSLYLTYNSNLLYHGCIPLNEDGSFREAEIAGSTYRGRALYDVLEKYARKAFFAAPGPEREYGQDILWYLWTNENSPLFGKEKMATFERYLISDHSVWVEKKNPYYKLIERDDVVDRIFEDFGLDPKTSHIVNGHMPVDANRGESPIRCRGRVLIIDGGFSKPYHEKTHLAGYTLVYNSWGLRLMAHQPFTSAEDAIREDSDVHSDGVWIERKGHRIAVADTDNGRRMQEQIEDLRELLEAYRSGAIREKVK